MLPLTSSAVTTEFLADRPFLLLNAPVFETRYVGSLLAKGAVKSKGGIALPTEIWLKIFEIMLPPQRMSKYYLARAITATFCGDSTTVSCEIEQSGLPSGFTFPDSAEEVWTAEHYLAAPDQHHGLSFFDFTTPGARPLPKSRSFSITVTDSDGKFLPHCLFHEITVPDVIARVQDTVCFVCGDEHTICPGCTGGVAQRFDAFMGCGVQLACPLCLGLDFMQQDKTLLETYYWEEMPEEERTARDRRFEERYRELGYRL